METADHQVTRLIDLLNKHLEPNVQDGVGTDIPLLSIAVSMKRIADAIDQKAMTSSPLSYALQNVQLELHEIRKEINAGVRLTNKMHMQVF
jgi:hypothetical protein